MKKFWLLVIFGPGELVKYALAFFMASIVAIFLIMAITLRG
jgi:hypothetical protein